ncbi:MAG: glycosyltransferase family 4 protein [Bacteroidota bacterium]
MERIVVYNTSWSTLGGGEKYACALAQALSTRSQTAVSLLMDSPGLGREQLEQYFHIDLSTVDVAPARRQEVRTRLAAADIGVVISNFRSFGLRAHRTVYVLQIPYTRITPLSVAHKLVRGHARDALKDLMRRRLLAAARHADLAIVYSDFVREVLARNHGIHAHILHPPIDDFGPQEPKRRVILSVGRIFTGPYNDKRYPTLIASFKRLYDSLADKSWEYRIVGSAGNDKASRFYLASLQQAAAGYPITFCVNSSYEALRSEYRRASVFWHATGHGIDERRHPERMEHFGMSTVEAMSAGCIPVVINAGGQKEIVSHGISGYLWSTEDQLIAFTRSIIDHPSGVPTIRLAARERYNDFSRARFLHRTLALMNSIGNDSDGAHKNSSTR